MHHDLWDYDVPAQPALYDIPNGKSGKIPALVQITKRGQIFVLDRRNGAPIAEVLEKPVLQGGQQGGRTSPTQPYSVGMPAIGADPLTEPRMWGMIMFDQLWCRIEFRKLRYEGDFTPPTTTRSLLWPGFYGGMNWGSAAINATNDYLIINDIRMAQTLQLLSRDDYAREVKNRGPTFHGSGNTLNPQADTPFAMLTENFMSPLGTPCQNPPYGTMSAVDLKTRKIIWQRPFGTAEENGPLGIKTRLKVPIGVPTLSGSVMTKSGLIFFAGTQDYYLRAMDLHTGKELWRARLPVGAKSTPMTCVSPTSGRQYVVTTAGGARLSPDRGDYMIAYALPERQ